MTATEIAQAITDRELLKFHNGWDYFEKKFRRNYSQSGNSLLYINLITKKGDFERDISSAKEKFMGRYYDLLIDYDVATFQKKQEELKADLKNTLQEKRKFILVFLWRDFSGYEKLQPLRGTRDQKMKPRRQKRLSK